MPHPSLSFSQSRRAAASSTRLRLFVSRLWCGQPGKRVRSLNASVLGSEPRCLSICRTADHGDDDNDNDPVPPGLYLACLPCLHTKIPWAELSNVTTYSVHQLALGAKRSSASASISYTEAVHVLVLKFTMTTRRGFCSLKATGRSDSITSTEYRVICSNTPLQHTTPSKSPLEGCICRVSQRLMRRRQ
ncbi:hypothetical protein IF1G_00632 [Cordyceps javanica]|uniref:Uncharacterized protein n=1 Tax=Cordyceps javanica TaxID=43265 RepID=A0A545VG69_9HYPO|nr:hypothetical protein IF1G_00632 [Cordyceps javanica]